MDAWKNKIALVTGASSGIGASVCQHLVQYGITVIGIARRVERVNEIAKSLKGKSGKLIGHKCDVSNPEEISATFDWVKKNYGLVDILINNAGILRPGPLSGGDPKDWQAILNTNVIGLTTCFKHVVEHMDESGSPGYIINVNSIAGHHILSGNLPMMNMYCPSKHAVTCLTEMMARELHYNKSKVRVTSLSPGLVETEIFSAVREEAAKAYAQLPHLQPEDIADMVIMLLSTKPNVHIKELMVMASGESITSY